MMYEDLGVGITARYYVYRAILRALLGLCGVDATGVENIPPLGPVILAPNHISHIDPPLVGTILDRPVFYMAKHELFTARIIGPHLPFIGSFPVHRDKPDRKAIRTALTLLERGQVLVIFPEGTRSIDGRLQPAERGVGLLALKSRAPVYPVGIKGTNLVLPPGATRPHPSRITVTVGRQVPLMDLYGDKADSAACDEAAARIVNHLAATLGVEPPTQSAGADAVTSVAS